MNNENESAKSEGQKAYDEAPAGAPVGALYGAITFDTPIAVFATTVIGDVGYGLGHTSTGSVAVPRMSREALLRNCALLGDDELKALATDVARIYLDRKAATRY